MNNEENILAFLQRAHAAQSIIKTEKNYADAVTSNGSNNTKSQLENILVFIRQYKKYNAERFLANYVYSNPNVNISILSDILHYHEENKIENIPINFFSSSSELIPIIKYFENINSKYYQEIIQYSTIPSIFGFYLSQSFIEKYISFLKELKNDFEDIEVPIRYAKSAFMTPAFIDFIISIFRAPLRHIFDGLYCRKSEDIVDEIMEITNERAPECPNHIKTLLRELPDIGYKAFTNFIEEILRFHGRYMISNFYEENITTGISAIPSDVCSQIIKNSEEIIKVIVESKDLCNTSFPKSMEILNFISDFNHVICYDSFDIQLFEVFHKKSAKITDLKKYEIHIYAENLDLIGSEEFISAEKTVRIFNVRINSIREYFKYAPLIPKFNKLPANFNFEDFMLENALMAEPSNLRYAIEAYNNLSDVIGIVSNNINCGVTIPEFDAIMEELPSIHFRHQKPEEHLNQTVACSKIIRKLDNFFLIQNCAHSYLYYVYFYKSKKTYKDYPLIRDGKCLNVYENKMVLNAAKKLRRKEKLALEDYQVLIHLGLRSARFFDFINARPDIVAVDATVERFIFENKNEILREILSRKFENLIGKNILKKYAQKIKFILSQNVDAVQLHNDLQVFRGEIEAFVYNFKKSYELDDIEFLITAAYITSGSGRLLSALLFISEFAFAHSSDLAPLKFSQPDYVLPILRRLTQQIPHHLRLPAPGSILQYSILFTEQINVLIYGSLKSLAPILINKLTDIPINRIKAPNQYAIDGKPLLYRKTFDGLTRFLVTFSSNIKELSKSHFNVALVFADESNPKELNGAIDALNSIKNKNVKGVFVKSTEDIENKNIKKIDESQVVAEFVQICLEFLLQN